MRLRYRLTIGLLLIVVAVILGYGPYTQYRQSHRAYRGQAPVSQTVPADPVKQLIQGKPRRIEIPSLQIDLSIIDGYYNADTKAWTLTNDKAQYAVITPEANNQSGNTFVYGHAVRNVFGKLPGIKPGAEVIITTENNHKFTYKFRSSYETNPNDDSLFHYEGPSILTLQTCSGIWYQNRQLFTFDLVEVA